jgi:hypothetical protein
MSHTSRVNEGSDLTVEGRRAWWGVQGNYDVGSVARTRSVAVLQRLYT